MKKYVRLSVASAVSLSLAGCASTASNTQIGCTAGAVIGAVIGHKLDKKAGAVVGGVLGTMVGCGIGHYLDEREKKLAELAKQNQLNTSFERVSMDAEKGAEFNRNATENVVASAVAVSTEKPLFDTDKASISDPAQLERLRTFLKGYLASLDSQSKIYIVGHTDATGSAGHNQQLSEARARFIADQLVALGAKPEQLFYEGVGENQPVASNDSEAGRASNRRFELHDVLTTDKAKPVTASQVATISTAKKQRLDNVVNAVNRDAKPKVSASTAKAPQPPVAKSKKTTKPAKPAEVATSSQDPLGLGGVPLSSFNLDVIAKLGFAEQQRGLFSKAYASELPIQSCAYAEPVVQSKLRAYTGQDIVAANTSDSLPNLYGTMWWAKVNTTGVALGPVGIDKDNLQPTRQPKFEFYTNYKGGNVKPDISVPVSVETYRGQDAVLVRMYAKQEDTPFRCSDVVFSTKGEARTKTTGVIYADNGQLFGREVELSLVKI